MDGTSLRVMIRWWLSDCQPGPAGLAGLVSWSAGVRAAATSQLAEPGECGARLAKYQWAKAR
jgi:hypothetical protein